MVWVHAWGEIKTLKDHLSTQLINKKLGYIAFMEESCIPRPQQILVRLFAQVLFELPIALEGLHKIFALKLDLCRLTLWQMHEWLEDQFIARWVGGT
jgi:hypothetical protein